MGDDMGCYQANDDDERATSMHDDKDDCWCCYDCVGAMSTETDCSVCGERATMSIEIDYYWADDENWPMCALANDDDAEDQLYDDVMM